MADRVGGEGPAPHTPQQQQLYADSHAAYPSGHSYLTENSFGPALRCPHCNTFLWKDSEGRFLECSCTNAVPHALPPSGPALHCSVCESPWSIVRLLTVWYDTHRDSVCERCFAWAMSQFKTVKLQRMYR